MVEHAAVNRVVEGSSPSSGANLKVVAPQRRLSPEEAQKRPNVRALASGQREVDLLESGGDK